MATRIEWQILALYRNGKTVSEISRSLKVSETKVRTTIEAKIEFQRDNQYR